MSDYYNGDKKSDNGKLFIGGLSYDTTVDELRDYFEQFGTITDCTLASDTMTGRSKGFGFVSFAERASAEDAINAGSHNLGGRSIEPTWAKGRSGGNKLFVGGVDEDITESEIRDYFRSFGKIEDLHLPVDRDTNQRKPFCFVTFESDSAAERALNESDHCIAGKSVDVKRARSNTNRGGGRGGGRGGYGGYRGYNDGGYRGSGGYDRGSYDRYDRRSGGGNYYSGGGRSSGGYSGQSRYQPYGH